MMNKTNAKKINEDQTRSTKEEEKKREKTKEEEKLLLAKMKILQLQSTQSFKAANIKDWVCVNE